MKVGLHGGGGSVSYLLPTGGLKVRGTSCTPPPHYTPRGPCLEARIGLSPLLPDSNGTNTEAVGAHCTAL